MSFKRDRLRSIRKRQRWPQDLLAKRIGISQSKFSQWERGITKPDAKELEKLARVLGVPVETFTGEAVTA